MLFNKTSDHTVKKSTSSLLVLVLAVANFSGLIMSAQGAQGSGSQGPVNEVFQQDHIPLEIRGMFDDQGSFGELSRSLYDNSFRSTVSTSQSKSNAWMSPIAVSDLKSTRQNVAKLLRENWDTVSRMSIFDMNFTGTHSIVLYDSPQVMIRVYVTPPGQMDPSHVDWTQPFLYHAHRYRFLSLPLEGTLKNERVIIKEINDDPDNKNTWYKYVYESPVFNVGQAKLNKVGEVTSTSLGYEDLNPGEAYLMDTPEIHRVGFIPDPKSNWSIVLFYEFRDLAESIYCYSEHNLKGMEDFGPQYRIPTKEELKSLVSDVAEILDPIN